MIRPLEHLNAASKIYPDAWKQLEFMIQGKGRDLPDWPAWCFMPIAGWYSIVSAGNHLERLTPKLIPDVARLAAIGTWRYCQGVYRFDDDLRLSLIDTELSGDIPAEVLHRLPEYCVYIETPGMEYLGYPVYGVWCHLESDANNGREELRLLLDTESTLIPVPLHLGKWTILESLQRADFETMKHAPAMLGKNLSQHERAANLQPFISLILYICSDEPEIDNERQPGSSPVKPALTKTRDGFRLFPPDRPRIWQVGKEIGIKLRTSGTRSAHKEDGYNVRPHIRRPHWHGFWSGPKEGERKFGYKWIPAILVNKNSSE